MAVYQYDCPHCRMDAMTFTVHWSQGNHAHFVGCATCNGCGEPICFTAMNPQSDQPPHGAATNIERAGYKVLKAWPSSKAPQAPAHTPAPVEKRFLEGEDSYQRGKWNSAVAMYRSALDIGTKAMAGIPDKLDFFRRLDWMFKNGRITQDIKDWADHVRVEGNAALHDEEEFTEVDATVLRYFTEMFLQYVYELPGEVNRFRDETAS